jgi:hypothetical protein
MRKQIKQSWHTVRISDETKKLCERISKLANKKEAGRKIKIDDILKHGLNLIKPKDIKELRFSSLTNEDRQEQFRQLYIKKNGYITRDDFIGFMMKPE